MKLHDLGGSSFIDAFRYISSNSNILYESIDQIHYKNIHRFLIELIHSFGHSHNSKSLKVVNDDESWLMIKPQLKNIWRGNKNPRTRQLLMSLGQSESDSNTDKLRTRMSVEHCLIVRRNNYRSLNWKNILSINCPMN